MITKEQLKAIGFKDVYDWGYVEYNVDANHTLNFGEYGKPADKLFLVCDDTFYNIDLSHLESVEDVKEFYLLLTGKPLQP